MLYVRHLKKQKEEGEMVVVANMLLLWGGDHVRSDGCYGGEMEWENTAEGWAVGTM